MDARITERSGETRSRVRHMERQDRGYQMTREDMARFLTELGAKGRTAETVERYRTALERLYQALPEDKRVQEGTLVQWREELLKSGYSRSSVNVICAACDNFLDFVGHREVQLGDRLSSGDRPQPELTRSEYLRLLQTAKALEDERGYLLVKVFATTGIFVQELPDVTVENIQAERFPVVHQGVRRMVRVPECLQKELLNYARRQGITKGPIFVGRSGQLLHRSRVAVLISQLCKAARVPEEKGNPRCLQKLYRNTRAVVEANVALLIEQAMDRQLEQEQLTAGWEA